MDSVSMGSVFMTMGPELEQENNSELIGDQDS